MAISKDGSPSDRIASAFASLKESSTRLNHVSDEIGHSVRTLDSALHSLNLGIKTWVPCGGWENSDGAFEDRFVGYVKVGNKWGIALSVVSGTRGWEEKNHDEGEWLFNDAPRALRAEAIDALPELVEALVRAADETANNIKAKTDIARELAKSVSAVSQTRK
jgi:hypothetical protein